MADMKKQAELKALLGFDALSFDKDDKLSFAIDYAEAAVKNYCRLDTIPEDIMGVVLMISKDFFERVDFGNLKYLKEGDVSFQFSHVPFYEDEIFKKYLPQLEIFRKPGW